MATFWNWGVRAPAAACAVVCVSAGFAQVADWSLALAAAMPFVLVAEFAGWALARAEARRPRRLAAQRAELRYVTLPGAPPSPGAHDRAA